MILDWSAPVVVAESPIWVWPEWSGEGLGPVRYVVLRGHAFKAVMALLHMALIGEAMEHAFEVAMTLNGAMVLPVTAASHQCAQPTASGHEAKVPSVTGHQFIPLE